MVGPPAWPVGSLGEKQLQGCSQQGPAGSSSNSYISFPSSIPPATLFTEHLHTARQTEQGTKSLPLGERGNPNINYRNKTLLDSASCSKQKKLGQTE